MGGEVTYHDQDDWLAMPQRDSLRRLYGTPNMDNAHHRNVESDDPEMAEFIVGSETEASETSLRTPAVVATAFDHAVRARMTGQGGVEFELDPRMLHGYTERALADRLVAAVAAVFGGYQEAARQTLTRAGFVGAEVAEQDTQMRERVHRFAEAAHRMESVASSPYGFVDAVGRGLTDIDITIRPGTLRRLPVSELAAEAGAAVSAVLADRRKAVVRLYCETWPVDTVIPHPQFTR